MPYFCLVLTQFRNDWAHQYNFSSEDAYRTLDNIHRVLYAFNLKVEAAVIDKTRKGLILIMAKRVEEEIKSNADLFNAQAVSTLS